MDFQKHDLSSYNLTIIKTDKFKTVTVLVNFRRKIKKEEVTMRSFLQKMLLQSSKKYPTRRLLNIETEKLYGLELGLRGQRSGYNGIMGLELTMINEKYTEKGTIEKSLDLMFEVLFNPNIKNGAFDTKSFNIVKNVLSSQIKSIKDDTQFYSLTRMLEEMDNKLPVSYRMGYIEDLEKINETNLYEYYKSMIKSDLIDIYVIGDVDYNDMKSLVKEKFNINTIKKNDVNIVIKHKDFRMRVKKITEKEEIKQAKLSIGFKLVDLTDYERNYVMFIYNNILGGPGYSKLFQNVREKHSLAYTVDSIYRNADSLMIVYAGINGTNFNKTIQLIKQEIANMLKGNITDEEIENARKEVTSVLKHIEDVPERIIDSYISMDLLKADNLATREKKFLGVTKEDIKKVAKKVKMDTIFLLYGDEDNEKV